VRQRAEPGQLGSVVVGAVRRFRAYRNNRPEMSWPQAPEMEIANLIPIAFNRLPLARREDGAGRANALPVLLRRIHSAKPEIASRANKPHVTN
jgi:hypothetical protein